MMLIEEEVKEGYGSPVLHLRQPSEEVRKLLGEPERKTKAPGARVYWIYADRGLDFLVSTRTGRLLSIFYHRKGGGYKRTAIVRTASGIVMSATRDQVLDSYGEPYKTGGDFVLSGGGYVGSWLSYRSGIGFHFDRDGRVEVVGIFSPSQNRGNRMKKSKTHVRKAKSDKRKRPKLPS